MEEFEIIERVVDFSGKKGRFEFNDRNLVGDKRVMVTIVPEDKKKDPIDALLSTSLSADFRAKKITASNLMALSYGKNADGRIYICQPMGNKVIIEMKTLTMKEVEMEEIDVEDLIAL